MNKKIKVYRPSDCLDEMLSQLKMGKVKGSTTFNQKLDNAWTWKPKEANLWTGYANEGKSLFLRQLAMKKALEEGKKFVFSAPEDFPPEDLFDDMIHTLTGRTTDKDYSSVIDLATYMQAFELIKDKFIFVYLEPPNNTIQMVLDEFKRICAEEDIFGCIIDPLLKFARPKGYSERDDIYASYIGSLCVDFCRTTNTSFHLVMHQLTPQADMQTKKYPEPSMYRIKGGGSWADGFDNVVSIWRPNYAVDKKDTSVWFASQKIKKQKLVGIPQKVKMEFDRVTNRYIEEGTTTPMFDFDKFIQKPKRGTSLSSFVK